MNEYWFEVTGKVYADTKEQADELVYRYTLGTSNDMKVKEYEIEEATP